MWLWLPFDKHLYSDDALISSLLVEWQAKTIALAEAIVKYQREDYAEFTELCLLYLDNDRRSIKFDRPGAMHKAGWMAKILYAVN